MPALRRFRDRASFKSSEVIALFVVSLFCWMSFFVALVLIKPILDFFFKR